MLGRRASSGEQALSVQARGEGDRLASAMSQPVSVPFEVRGGSPTMVEITMPDGNKHTVRIATAVLDALFLPDTENPQRPGTPVFQVRATLVVE